MMKSSIAALIAGILIASLAYTMTFYTSSILQQNTAGIMLEKDKEEPGVLAKVTKTITTTQGEFILEEKRIEENLNFIIVITLSSLIIAISVYIASGRIYSP